MNAINKRGYQDVPMTRRRAQLLAEYANKLAEMLENAPNNQDLAEWVQSKIDRAADQIQSAYHYLDQEDDDDLEKAVGHKYTHRKRVGTDKRGRARYRYYYAEHQGGGISRASFEAGSAFKLTWKGRRGHFHIDRVEGDQVFITHDSRPSMTPVAISKGELRALLKSQHGKAEQEHVEKRRKEVEKIKSKGVKRGLGLALHRLRQAAQVAGVQLDERYQRKPKKKPAQVTDTPREDRFETMPEPTTPREQLTETAREQLAETVRNITAPSSPLNIDQANAQDTLTEDRTRSAESKAADKALIESARELAKTSERGEEIKSALVDLMNAQQLKRYKRATGEMSARAEDMIEKRRQARERLRAATSGEVINNFETMPETEAQPKKLTGPDISRYKRALSLAKKGKLYILDKLIDGKRSQESKEADQALIELAQEILEKDLGDVEIRTIYSKPSTMWTKDERLKVTIGAMAGELKTRQRNLLGKDGAEQSRDLRADARDNLIDAIQEHVDRFPTDEVIDARLDRDIARETAKQEARETQETRPYQPKTFTREIQSAIDTLKFGVGLNAQKNYAIENFFKVRKDGGVYKTTKTPRQLADRIVENLPDNLVNVYDFGEHTLGALITRAINEGVEARETPAELKDRIGAVITKRFRDSAVSQKAQITGEGQRKALIEMKRNIKKLLGDGFFNEYRRRGERSYMGLGAIEKTLDMSERLSDLYVDGIFAQALPPELERFKLPVTRFGRKAADEVAGAFANKYETVGEIRDNISTIKEQMRATIKRALDQTTDALVKRPTTLDLINQSYEKATERLNTDRQKNIENARALAQYTDNPQAHLAEIQELERQSDQAIAEQMEINREFASAYIHEASDLAERALETTKGEVIDNVMKVKTPLHANKFTATERGTANRKLMARIFNQVFEQVRREIGDEPIERGEKHPRNIADTVKKPSKTPAQFREDIDRAERDARERLAERWGRITQKSANHMIDYRAQLLQTIERIA